MRNNKTYGPKFQSVRKGTECRQGGEDVTEMLPKVLSDEAISEAIPEESEEKAVRWRAGRCSESAALLLAKSSACLKETREAGAYRSWRGGGSGGRHTDEVGERQ